MLTIKKPRAVRFVATACVGAGVILGAGCGDPGPKALLDGEKMINERRFGEAVDRLTLATHLLPNNPQAWNHRGLAHHGAGDVEEAAKAYRMALQLNENLAAARFNLGSLLLEAGDPDSAIQELGSFAVLRPTSVDGHVRLGSAQIRAGKWEDAASTFSHAFQLSDSNPEILNALGLIHLHRGERKKAYPFFDKAIELNANYAPAKFNRAVCEHMYGDDRRKALAGYQAFLAQHSGTELAERALIVATALDKELNPRPIAPPPALASAGGVTNSPTEARPLAFAQMTARATAGGDVAGGEVAETPTESPKPRAAPAVLEFKPRTERAAAADEVLGEVAATVSQVPPAAATTAGILPPDTSQPVRPDRPLSEQPVLEPVKPESLTSPAVSAAPAATELRQPATETSAAIAAAAVKAAESEGSVKSQPEQVKPEKPNVVASPRSEMAEKAVAAPALDAPKVQPEVAQPDSTPAAKPLVPAVAEVIVKKPVVAPSVEPSVVGTDRVATATTIPETPVAVNRSFVPEYRPEREPEERGILKRLDPRRFFRSREDKRATPLTPGEARTAATRPTATQPPAPAPSPSPAPLDPPRPVASPAPVKPPPPRYAYVRPRKPATGDRRAAAPVFLQGLKAHQENRLSDAIKLYQDAARLDSSLYEAHYNLGLASFRANDLPQALRAYEVALAVKPDSASARFNFAQALTEARYTRDAADELEKLIAAEPDQVGARLAAGNLYARELGDTARARTHYLKALELEPNHRQAQAIRYWLSRNR